MRKLLAAVLFCAALCPGSALADMVYYKSGETLKGLVIEEHPDRIVVSTEAGEWTILRRDIQEVFYDDPERNYLFMGNQALLDGNFSLAQMFFRRALQIRPDFMEGQDALSRLEDLKKKFEAGEEVPDPVAALASRWGVALEAKKNLSYVQSVQPGSFAEKSGIKAGDALIAAWGSSLAFLPPDELAKTLLGPAGSTVRLTLGRKVVLSRNEKGLKWPGVTLQMEPLGLTVRELEPTGVFLKGGLVPLDRVIEINGLSTRYMPLAEARKVLRDARGEAAVFFHRDLLIKRE